MLFYNLWIAALALSSMDITIQNLEFSQERKK